MFLLRPTLIAGLMLTIIVITAIAEPQILYSHYGNTDPTTEGWTAEFPVTAVSGIGNPSDPGAGNCETPCPFWRINDPSTASSSRGNYSISVSDANVSHSEGWALRARTRRIQRTEGLAEAANYSATFFLRSNASGSMREFSVQLAVTADGRQIGRVAGASDIEIGPASDYHLLEFVYNPDTQTADFRVNGVVRIANFAGSALSTSPPEVVFWGSGQSNGTALSHWNMVEFVLAPDSDSDGIANMEEYRLHGTDPYLADSDEDGLSDSEELTAGSNPLDSDSDDDGLLDAYEWQFDLDFASADDANLDADNDGLSNLQEHDLGTHPQALDSDGDGLNDIDEINLSGTNPTLADSDGDGLSDSDEINVYYTQPTRADSDNDGLNDGEEVLSSLTRPDLSDTDGDGIDDGREIKLYETDPLDTDSDDDGLFDGFEVVYGLDPLTAGEEGLDTDNDNLSNLQEQEAQTQANNADSDGDSINDGDEVLIHNSNPTRSDSDEDGMPDAWELLHELALNDASDASLDADNDGLTNVEEFQQQTDPNNPDTDSDGAIDGQEVLITATNPLQADLGKTSATTYSPLTFTSQDQALFSNPPPASRINLIPEELVEKSMADNNYYPGENRYGEVHTIDEGTPLYAIQEAWDRGWDACRTTQSGSTHSSCSNYSFTPSESLCRDGGQVDIHAISVQCCTYAGTFNVNDEWSNGCTSELLGGGTATYTLGYINSEYAGGQIPRYYNVDRGLGSRPTQAPPAGSYSYQVGAIVTVDVDVKAELIFSAESQDPGELDLTYSTNVVMHADNSSATPGESVNLWLRHHPDHNNSEMSSRWAAIGFTAAYDVSAGVRASAEYWSIDPNKDTRYPNPDFQVHSTMTLIDETFGEQGEFVGLSAAADDRLEFRFMDGVDRAPEFLRDKVFSITPEDINFGSRDVSLNIAEAIGNTIPAGTGLAISIPNVFVGPPGECPFKFSSLTAHCLNLKIYNSLFVPTVSQEMLNLRLQLPEINTPVSEGFWGGFKDIIYEGENYEYTLPKRAEIQADGSMMNTVPNGRRPIATDYTRDLNEALTGDQTLFSSDIVRLQWDIDGTFSDPLISAGLFEKTWGTSLINFTGGFLDFDVEMWAGLDQSLTFKPGLVADLRFNRDLEVKITSDLPEYASEDFLSLPAGEVISLPINSAGQEPLATLELIQPEDELRVEASYSFRNNGFINDTRRKITFAPSMTTIKLGIGGAAGGLIESVSGQTPSIHGPKTTLDFIPRAEVVLGDKFNEDGEVIDEDSGEVIGPRKLPGETTGQLTASMVLTPRSFDSDGDGISDASEATGCTDFLDIDSDDDGIPDGIEDSNRNGVVDEGEMDPCSSDSDNDGLQDGAEKGAITGLQDPDGDGPLKGTDMNFFVASSDPTTRTDPLEADHTSSSSSSGSSSNSSSSGGTNSSSSSSSASSSAASSASSSGLPSNSSSSGGAGNGGSASGGGPLPFCLLLLLLLCLCTRNGIHKSL